ncbi:MAG: aminoacyl-tRNA hydrolase [Treponema sp.]|jgi:ribosome-associated protein|nr:aminoacyl-tRNA hydrolase [Treponema sp.]
MDTTRLHESILNNAVITYSRSGGPGGQNVNKVNTKVTLRLRLDTLVGLSEAEMKHLKENLASRLTVDGEIVINSSEERSQRTNQERAFSRAIAMINASARIPKFRKPTKPSKAAREKRLDVKRLQSIKKSGRRYTPDGKGD